MADAAPIAAQAPAPTDAAGTGQPSQASASSRGSEVITNDTGKTPAAAKSAAPVDDFRPMKVKAGGKEHEITSRAQLERILQRGLPVQQSLDELAAERARIEPVAAALKALSEGDEESALEVLGSLLGDEKLVKVAEKRLMREVEKEKKFSGLSERERQYAAQVEKLEAERAQWARQQQQAKAQEEQQRAQQATQQARAHIAEAVGGALKQLGLPPELEAQSLAAVRPLIAASIAAGQPLDPTQIAEEVREYHASAIQWAAGKLQGKALLDFFGPAVGKAYRAALLEQIRQPGTQAQPQPTNGTAPKPAEPVAAWDPRRRTWVGS